MDERISWESCPTCGERAAVGWELFVCTACHSVNESPVEFDCPAGCQMDEAELPHAFLPG
jgi:predicted metal-binding protein